MKNYIINGRVAREEIASDICDGILSRQEIDTLVRNPDINVAFIGKSFSKKRDRQDWDRCYLETLPNVAVAEAFNEDYLYYLADVAEYVNANRRKKPVSGWIWFTAAVVILGVAVFFIIKSRS